MNIKHIIDLLARYVQLSFFKTRFSYKISRLIHCLITAAIDSKLALQNYFQWFINYEFLNVWPGIAIVHIIFLPFKLIWLIKGHVLSADLNQIANCLEMFQMAFFWNLFKSLHFLLSFPTLKVGDKVWKHSISNMQLVNEQWQKDEKVAFWSQRIFLIFAHYSLHCF